MANLFTAEKTIRGKKYIAQFNGISAALRAIDESYIEGTNNTSIEKLSNYLFEHVIVEPSNLQIDDFDDMGEFNEVIAFARAVMQGDFRENKNKERAKKTSKE